MKTNKEIIDKAGTILKDSFWKYAGLGAFYILVASTIYNIAFDYLVKTIFGPMEITKVMSLLKTGISYGVFFAMMTGCLAYFLDKAKSIDQKEILPRSFKECLIVGFTRYFTKAFITGLLVMLFTTLWGLLLIIPGIVKAFSYSMSFFVMLDNTNLKGKEILDQSCKIMQGKRRQLFNLYMLFIVRSAGIALGGGLLIMLLINLGLANSDFLDLAENFSVVMNGSMISIGAIVLVAALLECRLMVWLFLAVAVFYKEIVIPSKITTVNLPFKRIA